MNRTLVFDTGALIAVERRSARLQSLIQRARLQQTSFLVPTAVVAQVVRAGGRQANLRRFLTDPAIRFAELDYPTALQVGALLGESGTSDVVDAAVVICARTVGGAPVVTSDPDDITKLDPTLPLLTL
ncbi:hypothetical protein AB0H76_30150 [Nocardia sp. NPDC050712]|uniref:hypothetical protein n=1 Tax=Nocardia sp. NPDC050712 TaxID=3155518 RepID=UPI00340B416C